jgi:tetratricopeptide (TPR) repeat protein
LASYFVRIGVYSIALNEQKFANRWAASCADADYRFVVDTGSSDQTTSLLHQAGVEIEYVAIRKFRFDDARNVSLHLLPVDLDVIICLDLDEVLVPGWREHIERCWTAETTRLRYRYIWSWTANQQPDLIYYGDKISGRFTHRWKAPVHEVLHPTVPEVITTCETILIEHHPDPNKSRSAYLPLLQLAVLEDPHDDRNAHYLGREYFYRNMYPTAIAELERHLALPKALWLAERAASMRYIAKCYEAMGEPVHAHNWFVRATLEDPTSREALLDLARFSLARNAYYATIDCCQRAIALPVSSDYMAERYAQAEGAYDLMAVASHYIGDHTHAEAYAKTALSLNPGDPRLGKNLQMMVHR